MRITSKTCCYFPATSHSAIDKVAEYVVRHRDVLFNCAAVSALLFTQGASWSQITRTTVPGAAFMLVFQKGHPLVSDWLTAVDPKGNVPLQPPSSHQAHLLQVIEQAPIRDFTAIVGPSGIGKSVALRWVEQELAKKESQRVYRFNIAQFLDHSYRGDSAARFAMLKTFLKSHAVPPILVVDEFNDFLKLTGLETFLKQWEEDAPDDLIGSLRMLVVTETKLFERLSDGMKRRFRKSVTTLGEITTKVAVQCLTTNYPDVDSKDIRKAVVSANQEKSDIPLLCRAVDALKDVIRSQKQSKTKVNTN